MAIGAESSITEKREAAASKEVLHAVTAAMLNYMVSQRDCDPAPRHILTKQMAFATLPLQGGRYS